MAFNANKKIFPLKQTLETIMVLFNLFAILWFFSHSFWFPITIQAFWFSYNKLMLLLNNSFYTFLLLNAILLSLYAFSNTQNGAVSSLSNYSNDFYNEYQSLSDSRFNITENETEDYKPVTCSDEGGECCSEVMGEKTVTTAITETTTTTTVKSTTTSGEKEVSEKKCYRRIQSESVERRRMVAEFKRYNSNFSKRSCHVERLSKEEFNRAVEDFIAKQKRLLWEEQRETKKFNSVKK